VNRAFLLSGVPAAGKSRFGRYLARDHGFAHYDLECHPAGWPIPDLKLIWDQSPTRFISELRMRHDDLALDWGFPPHCRDVVRELQAAGVILVWFECEIEKARTLFEERGGRSITDFERQAAAIAKAGFPAGLGATVVQALTVDGSVRPLPELSKEVLGDAA
jgi:hypothetical protein